MYKLLLEYKTRGMKFSQIKERTEVFQTFANIKDKMYLDFVEKGHEGFYFNKALYIYRNHKEDNDIGFYSLEKMNLLLVKYYGRLFRDLIAFSCDIFGNQFVFAENGIEFFNIETAERELVAGDFTEWIHVILKEKEYYTGVELLNDWEKLYVEIKPNERLTPKKPFVLGGEYTISNLKVLEFDKVIAFNSSIAKQIKDLPDGTEYKIKFT